MSERSNFVKAESVEPGDWILVYPRNRKSDDPELKGAAFFATVEGVAVETSQRNNKVVPIRNTTKGSEDSSIAGNTRVVVTGSWSDHYFR